MRTPNDVKEYINLKLIDYAMMKRKTEVTIDQYRDAAKTTLNAFSSNPDDQMFFLKYIFGLKQCSEMTMMQAMAVMDWACKKKTAKWHESPGAKEACKEFWQIVKESRESEGQLALF